MKPNITTVGGLPPTTYFRPVTTIQIENIKGEPKKEKRRTSLLTVRQLRIASFQAACKVLSLLSLLERRPSLLLRRTKVINVVQSNQLLGCPKQEKSILFHGVEIRSWRSARLLSLSKFEWPILSLCLGVLLRLAYWFFKKANKLKKIFGLFQMLFKKLFLICKIRDFQKTARS